MSMKKIDEKLIEFLERNPGYFTEAKDEKAIRSDLSQALEDYARAYDPETYEELTERVIEFNARVRADARDKMAQLIKEKELQTKILREAERESQDLQNKFEQLSKEMSNYSQRTGPVAPTRSNGGALDYLSAFLDILGIGFLYAGFILTDQINMMLVFIGFGLLFAGLFLYMCKNDGKQAVASERSRIYEKFQTRFDRVKGVWEVKRMAIQYKVKSSKNKLNQIDAEIEQCLQHMSFDSE